MGWDIRATADAAVEQLPEIPSLPPDVSLQQAAAWVFGAVLVAGVVAALFRLVPKLWRVLEETLFSNWRLALLGATGIALSLASGYTTWDGMRNFTGEATLSLLITFGIQGVMLIMAWLIGESFATGMSQTQSKGGGTWDLVATSLFGLLVFAVIGIWAGQGLAGGEGSPGNWFNSATAEAIQNYAAFGAVGALVIAFIFALAKSDIGTSYVQSTRVIIKNAVLWLMFLSCMATSVFFSFDSLFTAIFPQDERVRAAELRAQNQVAGVVADIGTTIEERKLSSAQELFVSEGWAAYDRSLARLSAAAKESEGAVEKYFHAQAEARNRAVAEQQERIVSSQSGQAGLASRKTTLTDELARLKGERPGLAAEYGEKKTELEGRAKEIDAKRVEAMAEDKGVEGTGKVGKGPVWRERIGELGRLNDYYKVGEERVKDAKKRLDAVESRIAQIERELAQVDGDLAKLKGDEETASQRISMTQQAIGVEDGQVLDPSRMLPGFEKARAEFRQEPAAERLVEIQKGCSQILGAMTTATPATKAKVAGLDCDPKSATEAAAVLFSLNAGSQSFAANCAGGDKLTAHTSADALFGFARRCLADSGLPSVETDALRAKINFMELNRDDKAHRFVVTWNAFQDGNRLAYLALAIAIAIDALVFMSGLFGANAVRSPLSDVPSVKARSAQHLEATINAALGAHQYETAALVLRCLRPITNTDGFSAQADLSEVHPGVANRVRLVLSAGADIGAVETLHGPLERYRVRSELREYLSMVCDRHLKADKSIVELAKLEQLLREALRPCTHEHADITLNHFEPVSARGGYTSMVTLGGITDPYEERVVRRVMNAGAATEAIATDKDLPDRYYIKPDIYRALLMIRANDPPSLAFMAERRASLPGRSAEAIPGGQLDGARPAGLAAESARLRLTQEAANPPAIPVEQSRRRGSQRTIEELLEHFEFAMGIQAGTLKRYIEISRDLEMSAIRRMLRSVLSRDTSLLSDVRRADESLGAVIREARATFAAARALSSAEIAELDELTMAIDKLRTLLILGEDGAYRHVLATMEAALMADEAAGRLRFTDEPLLRALEGHRAELAAADVYTREGWESIYNALKNFNERLASYAGHDQPPAGSA